MKKYIITFIMVGGDKVRVATEENSEREVLTELIGKRGERFARYGKKLVNLDNVLSVEVFEHVEVPEEDHYVESVERNEYW